MHDDSALPYEVILPGSVFDGDAEYWFTIVRWAPSRSDPAEALLLRLLPDGSALRSCFDAQLALLEEARFDSWAAAYRSTQREFVGELPEWVPIPPGVSDHAAFAFRNAWRCE